MDFNVKKFASDAGVFFTRAVQFTGEKLGQSEKTELDAHFENLLSRADSTKNWTEKIFRQTEVLLQPNPIDHTGARIEEFLYEKLDRTVPSRPNNGELLGQYMQDAAKDFGVGTPYGSTLMHVGDCERRLGSAHREFLQTSAISFLTPLRNFLEGDWRTISKERRLLENRRLDLDSCKARLKKAKLAESKAACEGEAVPDFQETRPRNYVLSASASALWSEEVDKAEHELRVAQTEFDRQAEVTRLLLEGISSTHVNHLRCLHEFVEAQTAYYKQCHLHMQDLKKELDSSNGDVFPNAFAGKPGHSMASDGSSSPGKAVDPLDVASTVETDTLKIEEVQAPATGTRKAKVLYDYDAADTSELSLLADELITVYTVPGMDSDWLVGERGNQKGKVPVTYLELLS
ncbi:endophilin-B2a isoform X1 [Esox lucius]|uniref:Endophilin-B1 n=1 Tax=Esox lucius TaxID=8010 RepID=A0A6Q2XR26_ESOLU|nr:endophilin-B2a isoform X1 [Esox lucius]